MSEPDRLTATHLAGTEVVVGNRYYRQRCSWCGLELVDEDITLMAFPAGDEARVPFWEVGSLVRQSNLGGGVTASETVEPDVRDKVTQSPADACWQAYLAKPEDAEDNHG